MTKSIQLLVLSAIVLLLLSLTFVSAYSTVINVKTLPLRDVDVYILVPGEIWAMLNVYFTKSDLDGYANVTYNGDRDKVDIKVEVKEYNTLVVAERFKDLSPKNTLYLQVLPGNTSDNYKQFEPVVAPVTVNQTNITANISNDESSGSITGSAVSTLSNLGKGIFSYWAFILTGIFAFVIVFGGIRFYEKKKNNNPFAVPPTFSPAPVFSSSPVSNADPYAVKVLAKKLSESEKNLELAKRELAKIKNQEKIKEIETRLAQEQSELDKLRKGY